jgi:hypothetical protein
MPSHLVLYCVSCFLIRILDNEQVTLVHMHCCLLCCITSAQGP